MGKIMYTNHKVVKFLGIKIMDIWEDYLERRIVGDEIITTNDYSEKKENDN